MRQLAQLAAIYAHQREHQQVKAVVAYTRQTPCAGVFAARGLRRVEQGSGQVIARVQLKSGVMAMQVIAMTTMPKRVDDRLP